jgi:hypothetical protein
MALASSTILVPSSSAPQKVAALASSTSSGELVFGVNSIIAVNATKDITIKFGQSGMAAAAATDWRIPANTIREFDLGQAFDRLRVFNLDAAATDVYIGVFSRF